MPLIRVIRELRSTVDAFDVVFGFFPWMSWYVALLIWSDTLVRAIRGERSVLNWWTSFATGFHLATRAVSSATEVRESVALRKSVGETGQLLREAAKEAEEREERMREFLRQAAKDAEAREKRAAKREDKLYKIAALTLLAAIVTLVVTIIK